MKENREEKLPRREAEAEADGLIEGRNAVTEALRAGAAIDKIYLAKGETDKTLGHIASTARAKGMKEAVAQSGWLGVFTGSFTAGAAGIAAAVLFALLFALLFKPADKR